MEEEWRKIEGYDNYSVSNYGDVMNDYTGHIFKPKLKNGYVRVALSKNKKVKSLFVHVLMGKAFIPNPDNLPQINHKNQIRNDNRIDNLEWSTNINNSQSKNKTCQIGCVSSYKKNGKIYYKAKVTVYGKQHTFDRADRNKCEEWLKNRRYEIENELEITKDKKY